MARNTPAHNRRRVGDKPYSRWSEHKILASNDGRRLKRRSLKIRDMKLSLKKRLFHDHAERAQGCSLIDSIAALAQSSHDLNTALRCAADEIGSLMMLGRVSVLVYRDGRFRRAGDYCANQIGPVEKEKYRQLDLELTGNLNSESRSVEITNADSNETVSRLLNRGVEGIGNALKISRVVIYRRGSSGESNPCAFKARAEYRASVLVPSLINSDLDLDGSPVLERVLSGEVIDVPDTNDSDPIMKAISVRLGVRAIALAPIRYEAQTVATTTLEQFDNPRVFSQPEMMLLGLATEQIAVALYQAELHREAQDAARRDALISKIGSAIHSSLNSEAVLQAIVDELGAALSVCRCRLALLPTPLTEMVPI